jgi:DNA invertase Pin-like site-specific DNA recombinase
MRRAFSYIRFSTPEQLKGDSLRRQTSLTADYCERNHLQLDDTLNLRDLGVSAFRGSNAETGRLAAFLDAVKRERVPEGSVLVVENLDRLTRDEVGRALSLFISILDSGIRIVTLAPEVEYTKASINDISNILQAVLQLFLGHEESAKKSGRLARAWKEKRTKLKEKKLTGKCPFWLRLSPDGTRFIEVPERVAIVKRIYRLARHGYGSAAIAAQLNQEAIPSPYGRLWSNASVLWTLRNRAAIGEFVPHRGRSGARQPAGPPVPNYYPAVIGEDEFWAVQSAIASRLNHHGPRGKGVRNLFTGLIWDARDGTRMHVTEKRKNDPRMISSGAMRGKKGARYLSFSFPVFEQAILSMLKEVDPMEILGQDDGPDEVLKLSGEMTKLEAAITAINAELDAHGESPALYRRVRAKEDEYREVAARHAKAQERAATPLSDAWGEARTLLDVLKAAKDPTETRSRLRSVLQRIIKEIWVLVVPRGREKAGLLARGRDRIAAVQVWFADGEHQRSYLILHHTKVNAGDEVGDKWWAHSLATLVKPGARDLRNPEQARKLETMLAGIDPAALVSPTDRGEN